MPYILDKKQFLLVCNIILTYNKKRLTASLSTILLAAYRLYRIKYYTNQSYICAYCDAELFHEKSAAIARSTILFHSRFRS